MRDVLTVPVAPPTPRRLRDVMGRFPTGVTVVTCRDGDEPHGMTASSVTSVSLDPPLVLVCVRRGTTTATRLAAAGRFALSILAGHQAPVARRFADPTRPAGARQFASVPTTTGVTGAPLVAGALGWVEADVDALHDGGDHVIVVGRVVSTAGGTDAPPLVFHRGTLGVAGAGGGGDAGDADEEAVA